MLPMRCCIPLGMPGCVSSLDSERVDALLRSAALVRAEPADAAAPRRPWRRRLAMGGYVISLSAVAAIAVLGASRATPVHADGSADAALFSLTNQDRASNGVRSLNWNGTLQAIGEGAQYGGCGFAVNGRAVDMIQRNYFAHPIKGCGQLVFSMMQAFGVHYLSAGENIGWNVAGGAATAAAAINNAFMNSPDHRSNILNGNYTDLGTGSDNSGAQPWTGGGGSYQNAWMFTEEFAQLSAAPPPPPPPPPPTSSGGSSGSSSGSGGGSAPNSAASPAPAQPAAVTGPTAAPATATPTPTPAPTALPGLILPPPLSGAGGLLFDSVESVLESYLIN